MQHIQSRESRAVENSYEIYVEVVSNSDDVVAWLRERIHDGLQVRENFLAATDGPTSARSATSVRHNVFLNRNDALCMCPVFVIRRLFLVCSQIPCHEKSLVRRDEGRE